jgi:hypothetical protein
MAFALDRRDVALAAMDVAIKQARWSQMAQRYVQRREEMRTATVR